jgi:hypothetical protein
MQWRTPQGLRPAGRASEESDDHLARPEANASARTRDDLRDGARLPPRVSDRYGKGDETAQSGGSVKRSGIERGRRRRDAKLIGE